MADTHRTIFGSPDCGIQESIVNAEAITPGMLCTKNSSGNLIKHNVGEVATEVMIATENALYGRDVTTAYSSGDMTSVWLPPKGAKVNVLVEAGQNVVPGDYLVSGGNGLFIEPEAVSSGTSPSGALLKADESSGGVLAANTLIRCRVL